MHKYRKIILSLALLVAALLTFSQVDAISIRGLLGLDDDTAQTTDPVKTGGGDRKVAEKDGRSWGTQDNGEQDKATLAYGEIQRIFANINADERKTLLNDSDKFKQFIQQQADNLSVLQAARANNLDKDKNTAFLMKLSAENVLRETYLNKLIANKLPADFPSDKQVRQYYDKNKDSFYIGERMHVWQIFLRTDPQADEEQTALVGKRIRKIRQEILDNKIDFADAAFRYSEHGPSRATGGYMGLIKVSDLKPELSDVLMKLPEGKLSEPVKDDSGYHILKRGGIVPKQDVSFDQVKNQIHDLLVKEAKAQLRKAIYNQAAKTYPVDLQENTVEQWRQRLLK